jgi:SAM-dependent methyltransferase
MSQEGDRPSAWSIAMTNINAVRAVTEPTAHQSWPEFLKGATLFENSIRLRDLLWTIKRFVPLTSRLIEVGCGSGTAALLLADMGYRVAGVDLDPALVANASRRYSDWVRTGELEFQVANMFALPWHGDNFDLAYHQGVLEHFSDDEIIQALGEQHRIAKQLIFDVPNNRSDDRPYGNERLLPPSRWRRLLSKSGWRIRQELGRGFHHPLYVLPHALFARKALEAVPWFSRKFAVNSIFVCTK